MTDIDKIRANALIYGTGNAKVIVVALSSFDALCDEVEKLRRDNERLEAAVVLMTRQRNHWRNMFIEGPKRALAQPQETD